MTSSVRDPYTVLGLSRSASAEDIKRAHREMVKKYHPDRNANDKHAESKMKEANNAYSLLSDSKKRARFDAGEIDANGNETGGGFGAGGYRQYGNSSSAKGNRSGFGARSFFDADDFTSEDIINTIFGGKKKKASSQTGSGFAGMGMGGDSQDRPAPSNSRDINYTLKVPFIEAIKGSKRTIKLGDRDLSLSIPAGTQDGTKLRLKGQGMPARGNQTAGDAYITIQVEPHPSFTRTENDIYCEVPITLSEAALGAAIRVPTLSGMVEVKVPKGANTGTTLRLKGKGIALAKEAGDHYIKLKIVLPDGGADEALATFLKTWKGDKNFNPRDKAGLD